MNSNSAIEITGLEFSYAKAKERLLSIPSLKIASGEKIFFFGPSGSGKTTFLELLSGVLVPQKGKVQIFGQDLTELSAAQRDRFRSSKMGYVFQNFNLLPYLTVQENIELPLHLGRESNESQKDFKHLTESLELSPLLDRPVTALSVGQQQRVALARALMGRPALILADEPTSALDQDLREKFLKVLFQLASEFQATILFVSHDRTLAPLFDRTLSIHELKGRV